ncbi:MAG TPA: carboxypeptidase-like regulatory domain-containing protein [Puia sp.]|nr:carboxypeptidase-like regulatory domain-containing protein [Puia sp.]
MKRTAHHLIYLAILFPALALAQGGTLQGTVKDEKGTPVPFASVQIKDRSAGTSTDSLGNFRIRARSGTVLFINAVGFEGDTLVVGSRPGLAIVLRLKIKSLEGIVITGGGQKKETANDPMNTIASQSAGATLNEFKQSENLFSGQTRITPPSPDKAHPGPDYKAAYITNAPANTMYHMSALPSFSIKEGARGSRYLLSDRWAAGTVTTFGDSIVNNPALSYSYDKMSQNLYATRDKETVIELTREQVKAFSVYDPQDNRQYVFERLGPVDSLHFFQVIVAPVPGKYSLYKQVKTRFEKSNYHSDGMVESGKPYDEWVDEYQYYIVLPGGKMGKKIPELKIKALKEMLGAESPRATAYISAHKYDAVDEGFLKGIVDQMNE